MLELEVQFFSIDYPVWYFTQLNQQALHILLEEITVRFGLWLL